MLKFITQGHIDEALKNVTAIGAIKNPRLMSAAWAALHEGYRGYKFDGAGKDAATTKLKEMFGNATPAESFSLDGIFFEEALRQDDSFDAIRCKISCAINDKIRAGIDMDGDGDGPQDAIDGKYAWVQDVYPDQAVYSMDGKLFQVSYSLSGDTVTLGTPAEVEMSYTPVEASTSEGAGDPSRQMCGSTHDLKEAAYDATKGELTMTIIKPGLNKSGQRFYPASTLKRDSKIFEGAKMFADHQTEAEQKAQPEGSVRNWVANVTKVWCEGDGTIKGKALVIDPQFKAKLDRLNESGLVGEMGVSIRAVGRASKQTIEGRETNYVESLLAARSVDFVTFAGAGGQVEAMESDRDVNDVDLISETELRTRRPDLIQLVESNAQKGNDKMKSLETQLAEATAALTTANTAVKEANKRATAAEVKALLRESKLPEPAQKRIEAQFKEAEKIDGVAEAIVAESEYIKGLGVGSTSTKKNMGAAANGEVRETGDGAKPNLEEAFKLLPGLSEKECKLAATGR